MADEIAEAARKALVDWQQDIGKGLTANKLESLEIEFFCIPLPSAKDFRNAFLKAMGVKKRASGICSHGCSQKACATNKIVRLTVRSGLDNLAEEVDETTVEGIDWRRLVFAGSILARSEAWADQEARSG